MVSTGCPISYVIPSIKPNKHTIGCVVSDAATTQQPRQRARVHKFLMKSSTRVCHGKLKNSADSANVNELVLSGLMLQSWHKTKPGKPSSGGNFIPTIKQPSHPRKIVYGYASAGRWSAHPANHTTKLARNFMRLLQRRTRE